MSVQFAVTVLQELFAVFAGGNPGDTGKRTKEIGVIIIAALVSNRIQRIITKHLAAGKRHTAVENVIIDTAVSKTGKLMRQI